MQQLPQETLVAILGGVPRQQRLQNCARVSMAWEAAAVQATAHDVRARSYSSPESFQAWLDKHTHQVISLTFTGHSSHQLRLPCAKLVRLQSLELIGCRPTLACDEGPRQADADSSKPGSAQAGGAAAAADGPAVQQHAATAAALLPALRSVALSDCRILPDSLAVLHSAQLTKLTLNGVTTQEHSTVTWEASQTQLAASVEALLQQQPRLAVLEVGGSGNLTAAALAAVAAMPLQQLSVERMFTPGEEADVLQLCSSPQLTALTLSSWVYMIFGASDRHALKAGPEPLRWSPMLQRLELQDWAFEPAALAGLAQVQLRHLKLSGCRLSPTHVAGRNHDDTKASNTAALLDMMASLKGLQSLEFDVVALAATSEHQLQRFSSLAASTALSSLHGSAFNTGLPLPRAALRHVLCCLLPALTELRLEAGDEMPADTRRRRDYRHQFCVEAADVDAIAASCPNLASLALVCVTPDGPSILASVVALGQQLSKLSKLARGHWTGWLTDDSVSSLTALSGLRELEFKTAPKLSEVGLLHLTALTGLRRLVAAECKLKPEQGSEFYWPGVGYGWAGTDECGELELNTPDKCAMPDVSRRLAEFLKSSPAISEYAAAQRSRVTRLEARLAEARTRLRAQAAELRALRGEPEPAAGGAAEEEDDGLGSTTGSEGDSEEEQPSSDDDGWW